MAFAALLPLAAFALALRRERHGRDLLGLPAPPPVRRLPRMLALAAVPALLGLAASQPALHSQTNARVRTDAQAIYVLDTSRSMLASQTATSRDRLARAQADAIAMRAALPTIPAGVATFTDRILPDLLPDPDPAVFDQTVLHAVGIEEPPPSTTDIRATTLDALEALGTQNFFPPTATRRLVVLFTDGESRPFNPQQIAQDLASGGPTIELVIVHVSAPGETVYDPQGRPEQAYREDPTSGQALASLASATGGAVFGESDLSGAIKAATRDLGTGPLQIYGQSERTHTLAPYAVLLALLPLFLIVQLGGAGRGRWRALWAEAAESARAVGASGARLIPAWRARAALRASGQAP